MALEVINNNEMNFRSDVYSYNMLSYLIITVEILDATNIEKRLNWSNIKDKEIRINIYIN